MKPIRIHINGANAKVIEPQVVTAGMVGLPVEFSFDSAWDGLAKIAVFRAGEESRKKIGIYKSTTVPFEVLKESGHKLMVGMYAVGDNGNVVIPTVWADAGLVREGTNDDVEMALDPENPIWMQVLTLLEEIDAKKGEALEYDAQSKRLYLTSRGERMDDGVYLPMGTGEGTGNSGAFDGGYIGEDKCLHLTLNGADVPWFAPFSIGRLGGLSAYEVAKANGFEGSEADWLTSLIGPQGPQGEQGQAGVDGPAGPAGADGKDGADGTPGADGKDGATVEEVLAAVPGANSAKIARANDGTITITTPMSDGTTSVCVLTPGDDGWPVTATIDGVVVPLEWEGW